MDELLPTLTLHRNDELLCRVQSRGDDHLIAVMVDVDRWPGTGDTSAELCVMGRLHEAWDLFPSRQDDRLHGTYRHLAVGDRVRFRISYEAMLDEPQVAWPREDGPPPPIDPARWFGLSVAVNGDPWRTAGYREHGDVGLLFQWSGSKQGVGDVMCVLELGGYRDGLHAKWLHARLHAGDEVSVDIVQPDAVDPPILQFELPDPTEWDAPGLDPRR